MKKKNTELRKDHGKVLPYLKRPFHCKMGAHEYDNLYNINGFYDYLGCINCYKQHWIYN